MCACVNTCAHVSMNAHIMNLQVPRQAVPTSSEIPEYYFGRKRQLQFWDSTSPVTVPHKSLDTITN